MRGKAEELREEVDASLSKLLSAKPSRRYTHVLHHHAWALLKHCMQHKAGYWPRNCLPSEVEAFAEAVDATILAAVERVLGVSFDPSTYGTDTNPVVTDFLAELLHDPDPMAAEVATLSEDAVARARSRVHLPTRLKGAGIRRMTTVRDAAFIGCMNAILPRCAPEREVEAASGSQKELTTFLDQANNSRLRNEMCALPATCRERIVFNQLDEASGMWTVATPTARTAMTPHELREVAAGYFLLPSPCLAPVVGSQIILPSTEHNPVTVDLYGDALMNLPAHGDAHWRVQHDAIADAFRDHCVHDLGIAVRREVDDLFQQAVPLGNTVPRDELKDLVPDAELSFPAFNVVTGSYDPRSLKSTLLEFKTMRYGVKYIAVPRAMAVDRFERSLLGDIQRGLAARDAAWHNTEPGQKGPLRDILHMSEYTGMVFASSWVRQAVASSSGPSTSASSSKRVAEGDADYDRKGKRPAQPPAVEAPSRSINAPEDGWLDKDGKVHRRHTADARILQRDLDAIFQIYDLLAPAEEPLRDLVGDGTDLPASSQASSEELFKTITAALALCTTVALRINKRGKKLHVEHEYGAEVAKEFDAVDPLGEKGSADYKELKKAIEKVKAKKPSSSSSRAKPSSSSREPEYFHRGSNNRREGGRREEKSPTVVSATFHKMAGDAFV
eukprot:jgi/Tetstr1/447728/TSEL_000305.t1